MRAHSRHTCTMLMIAFLDEPQMGWMVLLGFVPLGLISLIFRQSPYGAALLSHTEHQHQDRPPGEKPLSNLLKAMISISRRRKGGKSIDLLFKIVAFLFFCAAELCLHALLNYNISMIFTLFSKILHTHDSCATRGIVIREMIFNNATPSSLF